jgi:hypothetical protein
MVCVHRKGWIVNTDERRKEINLWVDRFFGGASMLHLLAGWAYVVARRREVVRALLRFEAAYEELLRRQELGEVETGHSSLSRDDLARVRRLCELIRPGLHRKEVKESAAEIEQLARLLHHALTGQQAPSGPDGSRG